MIRQSPKSDVQLNAPQCIDRIRLGVDSDIACDLPHTPSLEAIRIIIVEDFIDMSRAFEWAELSKGGGRLCGLIRGWDEALHETFAVLVDGRPFYGEVRKTYAGHHVSIEVVSFGYPDELDIANVREFAFR